MKQKWIALIPAFEPGREMTDMLAELKEHGFEMVIVNDGSTPDREAFFLEAARYGAVISHKDNRGKGAALKTGLAYIRQQYPADSIIVTMDADGQHKVSDAVEVCRTAECFPDRLILGSRKLSGKVPARSRFGNTVTRFVYRLTTGVPVYDTQTGLRAFSAKWIPTMLRIDGDMNMR